MRSISKRETQSAGLEPRSRARANLRLWLVTALVGIGFALYLPGIKQNLPYTVEVDEMSFALPALRVATSADGNPGWFGHPGSTIIYPLAALYRAWNFVSYRGSVFRPDPNLPARFQQDMAHFILLGRLLAAAYAALSIPLIYKIGRRSFGAAVALLGTAAALLSSEALAYAQLLRTDTAGIFFAMMCLWLYLRLHDRPTAANQALAGLATGLAMATRYLLAPLAVVLLVVDWVALRRARRLGSGVRRAWLAAGLGLAAIGAGFALSTPYFFLDYRTMLDNMTGENSKLIEGLDDLTPLGNLGWYLSVAIPQTLTWPVAVLGAAGAALALWRRRSPQAMLLAVYLAADIGMTSIYGSHVARYMAQALPVVALFAADALWQLGAWLGARHTPAVRATLAGVLAVSLLALPVWRAVRTDVCRSRPSTHLQAREWMMAHLPSGSRIKQEAFSAPLDGSGLQVSNAWMLTGRTAQQYVQDGYQYLVFNDALYDRYLANPAHYAEKIAQYEQLFADSTLVQRIDPPAGCAWLGESLAGRTILIYRLPPP